MNFEGGINKLLSTGSKFNNDFIVSLLPKDVTSNRGLFNALNLTKQLSRIWKLNAYHINTKDESTSAQENRNTYLIDNRVANSEARQTLDTNRQFFTITKLDFTCNRKLTEDISTQTVVKTAESNSVQSLISQSLLDSNRSQTLQTPKSWSVTQDFSYSNKFSSRHPFGLAGRTSIINANFQYGARQASDLWSLTNPIFTQLIPLQSDTLYRIAQSTTTRTLDFSFAIKELWVLNSLNHFYPMLGYSRRFQTYETQSGQLYTNEVRYFNAETFANDATFNLHDPYIGLQYRVKIGNVTMKTSVSYHHYIWSTQYRNAAATTTQKAQWIPEYRLDWKIRPSQELTFKYNLNTQFYDIADYSDRITIRAFNSLYRGNPLLENELSHQLSLSYNKSRYPTGFSYNASVDYSRKVANKQNVGQLEGINQINSNLYVNNPDDNLSFRAGVSQRSSSLQAHLTVMQRMSRSFENINSQSQRYQSNDLSYSFDIRTLFKKYPNIQLGIHQSFSNASAMSGMDNRFSQTQPFISGEYYFKKQLSLKFDYNYTIYENKNTATSNIYELANASATYTPKKSAWTFAVTSTNVFNATAKNNNFFSQFIVSDTRTFLQPRVILLKVAYKL